MNGTTYTGLTQTYVAPSNPELNAKNYAGPTQPYVIPPLQEPLPASPIRAATTNGYASGPQPAPPKAMEQHVSITLNPTSCTRLTRAQTSLSAPSTNFPSWPAPLPQSFTPVPISNSKDRHSKQADSSQQPTNQVNTVNSAPSQTRLRANTGRKTWNSTEEKRWGLLGTRASGLRAPKHKRASGRSN